MHAVETLSPPADAAAKASRGRSARLILLIMLSISLALGVLAYWRYQQSEHFIRGSMTAFERRGTEASVEQCVDEVISWTEECSAIIGLCDASVSRMMNACLRGQDRSRYCAGVPSSATADTRFGYPECKRRGVKGRTKKACAAAYRMLAAHCELLRRSR
jgi:hypothetical protein